MSANEVLSEIVQNIRKSILNFNMNITPFSAYVTIRSSFNKNYVPMSKQSNPQHYDSVNYNEIENENQVLSLKIKLVETENKAMKFEIQNLSTSSKNFETGTLKAKSESSAVKEEKRLLQIKHEKVCAEMKIMRTEKEDLLKEFNALSISNKTKKKEIFDLKKNLVKKSEEFETKLKD